MSNRDETFNAQAELEGIRARRAELVAMKQAGASCADLVEWLRVNHRCKVNRSSIDRYLKKLPELNGAQVVAVEQEPAQSEEDR